MIQSETVLSHAWQSVPCYVKNIFISPDAHYKHSLASVYPNNKFFWYKKNNKNKIS